MDQGVSPPPLVPPVIIPLDPPPEPLELLERFLHLPCPALLDGAADHPDLGRYSYLSADPVALAQGSAAEWPSIRERLRDTISRAVTLDPAFPPFQGGWIGWLGRVRQQAAEVHAGGRRDLPRLHRAHGFPLW